MGEEARHPWHDQTIAGIPDAIRQLKAPPPASSRPIGFVTGEAKKK